MPLRPPPVSAATPGCDRDGCWPLVIVLASLFLAARPLLAQVRPVAIENATVLAGAGRVLTPGTVTFQGGKITAVGHQVDSSLLTRKIGGRGKYVTPGLIDASSTLALRLQLAGGLATARAVDAFDWYADEEIRSAWRGGVTAVFLPARSAGGLGGIGSVIRLGTPGDPNELVLKSDAALCATIAAPSASGPLARVKMVEDLRRRFRAAKDYRDAWNEYDERVKEYETKLTERTKKDAAATSKPTAGKDAASQGEPKKPDTAEKKDEKKDELKKPEPPPKDRAADVLLRVIDGELRLRVEAHEPADILNVLDLADEFNLAVVLEGGSGAHLVAARLADRHVPVVLSEPPATVAFARGPARYDRPDAAAVLNQAGTEVIFGSGLLPSPEAAPHLALYAARAVGYGLDSDAALEAITSAAARLLGVEKEVGQLKEGLKADLVIWSDHPFAPGARVQRVFVGGQEVYRAEDEQQERDE